MISVFTIVFPPVSASVGTVNTETHPARFTRAIELELQNGSRREPIWNEALIATEGDETAAHDQYLRLRVEQLATDEAEWETAQKTRREQHRWQDEFALTFGQKNVLLATGVALALWIGWFLLPR